LLRSVVGSVGSCVFTCIHIRTQEKEMRRIHGKFV
jgi:hypothetical protein